MDDEQRIGGSSGGSGDGGKAVATGVGVGAADSERARGRLHLPPVHEAARARDLASPLGTAEREATHTLAPP